MHCYAQVWDKDMSSSCVIHCSSGLTLTSWNTRILISAQLSFWGAPRIDQQHLWLYKYVKSVARSRGSGSLNDSASARPQRGTVRVNKVNNSWWPRFVGTHSHNLHHAYTPSEPQSSMEMRDRFKTCISARSTKIQLSHLLSPRERNTCISSIQKSTALKIWQNFESKRI